MKYLRDYSSSRDDDFDVWWNQISRGVFISFFFFSFLINVNCSGKNRIDDVSRR